MMSLTRKQLILKYIIEDFIQNAEPVGSKTLMNRHNMDCSSATIRSVMSELEQDGLIEKTHASSGRIPSSKGYRYYNEVIIPQESKVDVDNSVKRAFQMVLKEKSQSVEDILKKSCQILSEVTNLAAVVLGPDANSEHLVSITNVVIAPNVMTSILVTDKGFVENKTFVLNSKEELEAVDKCISIVNKRLSGTPISEMSEKIEAIKPALIENLGKVSEVVIEALVQAFISLVEERARTYGQKNLLELPEYDSKKSYQEVIEFLSDPSKLKDLLNESSEPGQVKVVQEDDTNLAVVSTEVNLGVSSSKLALVGPERMDYQKISSLLNYIANELAKYFASSKPSKGEKKKKDEK